MFDPWQFIEASTIDKLLDKGGPLGIVVVFSGACAWFIWKLIESFNTRSESEAVRCEERAKQRNETFLEHNAQLARDHREHMERLVDAVRQDQLQTRAALDRLAQRLDRQA